MSSAKTKDRRSAPTALESWVLEHFGGAEAKQAIAQQAEMWVQKTGPNAPPVFIGRVAKVLGLDPWPIYENCFEGALKLVDGRLRIVLKRRSPRQLQTAALVGRDRFTYAHELGHALLYDLSASPPVRIAPKGYHKIEEQLCNTAASHFLMPNFLLEKKLTGINNLSLAVLQSLAEEFQTSVQAIAYRVAESFSNKLKPNQFYLLSAAGSGFRGTGLEKPRCVVCILGPELEARKISLLQSNQGIDRITSRDHQWQNGWSLQEFFQMRHNYNRGLNFRSQETVELSTGSVLRLTVCHSTTRGSRWVWSEGTIDVLEEPKIRKLRKQN